MSAQTANKRTPGATLYGMYVLALGVCLTGNLLIRVSREAGWLPDWGHHMIAIATAAPLAYAATCFWRLLAKELDEMLQRIVLEGLAFAVIVYVPLAALYVNLRAAGIWTPRLDPPDIVLAPAILVAIGIAFARRRYE